MPVRQRSNGQMVIGVGVADSPTGPFLDRSGVDLNDDETPADPTDGRAGGSPVIVGNDDPWVGTGHNTVFQDFSGIVNWLRGTGDQFAERSTGWLLATLNAVTNTAGLLIVAWGVIRAL